MQWLAHTRRSILLLILVALAAHGQMLGRGFVSDDWDWLHIGATATFPEYVTGNYAGEQGVGGSYRPVITVIMQLLYSVFGVHAFWYHALSLVLLVVTAIGIAQLAKQLMMLHRQREWIAWMSALFFVLMPTHAEAVYWVAGLPDLVAAAGMVWSTVLMMRFVRHNRWRAVLGSVLLWCVALGAKENAVVLPGIWLACTACIAAREWNREQFQQQWRRLVSVYGGAVLLLVLFVLVRRMALGAETLSYSVAATQITAKAAARSLLHTAVATVVGWHELRHQIVSWIWDHRIAVLTVSAMGSVAGVVWFARKNWRTVASWAALMAVGVIAAVPNSVVVYHPIFAEGERFAYFPSVFVVLLLALMCSAVIQKQRQVGRVLAVGIALSFVVAIPHYHRAWDEADRAFARVASDLEQLATPSIVVGLPEFAGHIAPVARNGVPQFYQLTHQLQVSPIGRLPYYTQWEERGPVQWVRDSNGWQATYTPSTTVWGPDVYADEQHLVELWEYNYAEQHGKNRLKHVYRPDDPRTNGYLRGKSPPVFAWSSEGFIPMPQLDSLK